ncbi:MAG TPA: lysylphosphatidylglycerol synthase transmembrane domain-containing protein [Gaiellaceae bacterium]|nr:lysylphosphatidylglycerol synthase transmembrane domain-containing protein [Gaiellaceae bacterium]
MAQVINAIETFFEQLAAVEWTPLAIALALQLVRLFLRAVAWRSIIAAAFPGTRVPLGRVTGAYFAGVGVNSIAPARGGDVVKLVLVKYELPGTTYTTLAPTLLVETLFDMAVASVILLWALFAGVLPALDALGNLPSIDWKWPIDHPRPALVVATVWLTVIVLLVVIWSRRVRDFREQVRHGFAILYEPRRYFTEVVSWQALSWVCRIAGVWFFLEAFHIPATARNVAIVLAVQSLSTLLPFTPGGIGTQQGFLLYAFRNTGVGRASLVSFSVGMHIATNAVNLVAGVVALLLLARTIRWKQLIAPERAAIERAKEGR